MRHLLWLPVVVVAVGIRLWWDAPLWCAHFGWWC